MRRGALLLALAVASGCGDRTSSADAARADSSAAGYAVGVRAPRTGTGRGETLIAARPAAPAAPNDTAPSPAHGISLPTSARTPTRTPGRTPTSSTGAGATGAAHGDSAAAAKRAKAGIDVATSAARPDSGTPPAPTGPVRVNEFLTYDQRSRTVSLQLISGYNGLNGSLNYNGATRGSHGLYVPTGWRIHIAVTNRDSDLQHSAIVVARVLPPPIEPVDPAFPGAALPRLDDGLNEDETGTLDFVAGRAGQYMIACGVPGHAQAGEWLQLGVSNSLTVPAYR